MADDKLNRNESRLTSKEADWDLFQGALPDASFMQTSWWAVFMETLGWGHFGVIVRDGETILGGARVLRNEYSAGHCCYYIPDGPILPEDHEDGVQVYQAIMAYIEKMRRNDKDRVSHLRFEPRWERLPNYITGFQAARNWMEPRDTVYIDLTQPEAAILAQMKPKGRYNVGLARRHGVKVVEDTSPKGLEDFLTLYRETTTRQQIQQRTPAYFDSLMATLTAMERGAIFFAEYAGIRVAAVLAIHFGRRVTYFYGGSTEQHRQVMAPYLLHLEIMLWAKARGYEWYDLYGIAPPDQPEHQWAGFSAFKRKLGGREFHFVPALDYIYDTDAYTQYEKTR